MKFAQAYFSVRAERIERKTEKAAEGFRLNSARQKISFSCTAQPL
jgi:hypothetical protein